MQYGNGPDPAARALQVPAEDRNRTSPFPYGGHRFEFRAVGSSQNPAWVNTILNSAVADAFARFADAIEGGRAPREVAGEALGASWRAIFNGDGYSAEWRAEAERRGVWRIDSRVEALDRLGADNTTLFERLVKSAAAFSPARRGARGRVRCGCGERLSGPQRDGGTPTQQRAIGQP